jgi:AcrR family transcriptional regulator
MTQRGRPKTFDRDHALEAAMILFWNRGFEQTSVDELAAAMGIQTSSLYSSFGDKESLYLEAVDHYRLSRGRIYDTAISKGKTAKEGFANLLKVAASEMTRHNQPKGSMLALALPTCSPRHEKLQHEVNRLRDFSETIWIKRLRDAVRNRELPESTDLQVMQLFFRNTLFGMCLLARAGESRDTLVKIGKLALRVWPSSERPSNL